MRVMIKALIAISAKGIEINFVFTLLKTTFIAVENLIPSSGRCTFQILGGCQGRRTGVGVTTVSNSLILGGWVTKILKNGDKK